MEDSQTINLIPPKGISVSGVYKERLLNGDFGTLFKKREEFLNQFQLKYLDYIEADVINTLIDVQKS